MRRVCSSCFCSKGSRPGLSWITVLRKREHYRKVLFGFDPQRLAQLSDDEIEALMLDPGIVRNRLKLNATRRNAAAWLALADPVGLLWSFVGGVPKVNHFKDRSEVPAITPEAEAMSKALEESRFHLRWPDHLLRVHAGLWHGHGPHSGLRPLRATWPTPVRMRALRTAHDQE